jgi:hypothetical protein
MRGEEMLFCTPHPPLRGTLSLQERDAEYSPLMSRMAKNRRAHGDLLNQFYYFGQVWS